MYVRFFGRKDGATHQEGPFKEVKIWSSEGLPVLDADGENIAEFCMMGYWMAGDQGSYMHVEIGEE